MEQDPWAKSPEQAEEWGVEKGAGWDAWADPASDPEETTYVRIVGIQLPTRWAFHVIK